MLKSKYRDDRHVYIPDTARNGFPCTQARTDIRRSYTFHDHCTPPEQRKVSAQAIQFGFKVSLERKIKSISAKSFDAFGWFLLLSLEVLYHLCKRTAYFGRMFLVLFRLKWSVKSKNVFQSKDLYWSFS